MLIIITALIRLPLGHGRHIEKLLQPCGMSHSTSTRWVRRSP
jgi:hypothetical protein